MIPGLTPPSCQTLKLAQNGTAQRVFTHAHDSGTVINPMAFQAQVEGSIVMGSREVLTEDVIFDERGRILNPNRTTT